MMRITFKQIEVFVAIAKTENMTQATEDLHLTQSACSMALAALEEQLNGALFDRPGKKLLLNDRGRVLFPNAVNIITQVNELQDLLREKGEKVAGRLIVGASTTIGNYLLPNIIGRFMTGYSNAVITLNVANTEQIIQQLLQFNIDVGMVEGACYSDRITVLPWKKDELIVIASPHNPLAKKKKITLDDLHTAKWILREPGSGTREQFTAAMKTAVHPFLELGNTEAVKQAVKENLGISCLSKTAVADALKAGYLVELKTPFLKLTRDFNILLHKDKYKTALLEKFIEITTTDNNPSR